MQRNITEQTKVARRHRETLKITFLIINTKSRNLIIAAYYT